MIFLSEIMDFLNREVSFGFQKNLSKINREWLDVLGRGANGIAYEYEDMVLKETTNPYEFIAAKKIIVDKPYWSPGIISAQELDKNTWLILKERVNIVEISPSDEDGEFYGVEGTLKSLDSILHTPWQLCRDFDFPKMTYRDLTDKEIIHISKKQKIDIGKNCYPWFYEAYKNALSFGADTTDLYQNIGVTDADDFVFFDVNADKNNLEAFIKVK